MATASAKAAKPARVTIMLDKRKVRDILKLGESGEEFGDSHTPGLCLWVQKTDCVWKLRGRLHGKQTTWRVGSARAIDLDTARLRAATAKAMAKRGEDPKAWLSEQELGGKSIPPPSEIEWTWERLRDTYLDAITKKDPETGEITNKPTVDSYRTNLTYPEVTDHLSGRDAQSIARADVFKIQEAIKSKGTFSKANGVLTNLRSCFRWARRQPDLPPFEDPTRDIAKLDLRKHANQQTSHTPIDHLTRLTIGEALLRLEETDEISTFTKNACILTMHSAQRRYSVAKARVEDFRPLGKTPFLIWRVGHRKAGNRTIPHDIVLLEEASDAVRAAMASARYGYLFPKLRIRRAGDAKEGYRDQAFITKGFRQAGLGFSPHKVRTAFASYARDPLDLDSVESIEDLLSAPLGGFKLVETKLILDHSEGTSGDITTSHYSFSQMIRMKFEIMQEWVNFLSDCKELAKNRRETAA